MHIGRIFPWQGTVIVLATLTFVGLAIFFQMGSAAQPVVQQSQPPAAQPAVREPPPAAQERVGRGEGITIFDCPDRGPQCGTIKLRSGYAAALVMPKPFQTIVIGDPKIVEATVQNDKTVVLTGKAPGKTDVIIFDNKHEPMFTAKIDGGGDPNLVLVHSRGTIGQSGQLQSSWTFSCPDRGLCSIVKDEPVTIDQQARLLSAQNSGGPLLQQNQNIEASPQQTTTTPSAPSTSTSQ